jgi:hypothetical protein
MYVRVKRKHATVFLRVDPAETAARVKERLQELLQQASEEGFGGRGVGGVSGADAREETARRPPLSTTPPRPQPAADAPTGIPSSTTEYVRLMFDMLHLAFQTDSTRVATFMLGGEGSDRTYPELGIADGHHFLTHHNNKPDFIEKVTQIDTWYASQLGYFLEKMEQTKDIDGRSLLDNSQIVYGSGNADGNRHSHDNLPVILAGGGGGTLNPGRYVQHSPMPVSNLFLSMMDRVGGTQVAERFGDSTGRLANI